jgi:hypothetical protein
VRIHYECQRINYHIQNCFEGTKFEQPIGGRLYEDETKDDKKDEKKKENKKKVKEWDEKQLDNSNLVKMMKYTGFNTKKTKTESKEK